MEKVVKKIKWFKWTYVIIITVIIAVSGLLFIILYYAANLFIKYEPTVHINKFEEAGYGDEHFVARDVKFVKRNDRYHDSMIWKQGEEKNAFSETNGDRYSENNEFSYLYFEDDKPVGDFTEIKESDGTHLAVVDNNGDIIEESKDSYINEWSPHHEMGMTSSGFFNVLLKKNSKVEGYGNEIIEEEIFIENRFDTAENPESVEISLLEALGYQIDDFMTKDQYGNELYTIFELSGTAKDHEVLHANSIEYNERENEIVVNSRNLGMFFAFSTIGLFEEDYVPTLNWVFSGTPYNYLYSYPDAQGDNPIIIGNGGYVENPNYDPRVNPNWEGKIIDSYEVDGVTYDYLDFDENHNNSILNLPPEYSFSGEHFVRYLNNYIETIPNYQTLYPNYDPNLSYYSMYDNHSDFESISANHNQGEYPYIVNEGFENDKSFLKVVSVDETNMDAKLIVNEEVPYSHVKGDVLFYTKGDENFVLDFSPEKGSDNSNFPEYGKYQGKVIISKYDGINSDTMTLNNKEIVYALSLPEGVEMYRVLPYWSDMSDVELGWNSVWYA